MAQKPIGFYYTYMSPNGLEFVLVKGPSKEPAWGIRDADAKPILFASENDFYAYVDEFETEFAIMIGLETNLVPAY